MFATLFVLLYLGHMLADYPLQTDHQAAHKADPGWKGWLVNLTHALTHVALSVILLVVGMGLLGVELSAWEFVGLLAWIGLTHAFIDRRWMVARWMRIAKQEGFAEHGGAHHVDQTAHILMLVLGSLVVAAV